MVSWFLLLCIGVVAVLLLAVNVYVLVHWSHPDDRNEAYFPKALVVRAHTHTPTERWMGDQSVCLPIRSWLSTHTDRSNQINPIKQVLGLLVAEACVLAVPLDVANNSNNIGCAQGWVTACGTFVGFRQALARALLTHPRLDPLTDLRNPIRVQPDTTRRRRRAEHEPVLADNVRGRHRPVHRRPPLRHLLLRGAHLYLCSYNTNASTS